MSTPLGGRPRRAGVEDQVRAAMVELVTERGYTKTSIEDIAGRANVARATIYRRWRSKASLGIDALGHLLDLPTVGGISREADIHRAVRSLSAQVADPAVRGLLVGLVVEAGNDEDIRSELRSRSRGDYSDRLSAVWQFDPDQLDLAFDLVVGGLLHRLAMTGSITLADADALAAIASQMLAQPNSS